jgi:hypothetical protein
MALPASRNEPFRMNVSLTGFVSCCSFAISSAGNRASSSGPSPAPAPATGIIRPSTRTDRVTTRGGRCEGDATARAGGAG